MPHENIDPSLSREVEQPSLDIGKLEPGQVILLELAEGRDFERSLTITARLNALPPSGECPELEVIDSDVTEETIAANRKVGLPNPDFTGQTFLVRGGCTRNPGNHPTMIHIGHIDLNREAWLAFELPKSARAGSMEYFPYVRGFRLITKEF